MQIYRVTEISEKIEKGLEKLLPQLSPNTSGPSSGYLAELLTDDNTHLLVAEIDGAIVGTLSLAVVHLTSGRKAWIEDVIVDEAFRGRNIGGELVEYAKKKVAEMGIGRIYLTSNPSRKAAHALYHKSGFEKYDTTVFRIMISNK